MITVIQSNHKAMKWAYNALSKQYDVISSSSPKTQIVAVWGWRRGLEYRNKGYDVLVFERAYLGDRHHYTSIAWNGLNGYGDFELENCNGDRFKEHFEPLKPWHDGEYIVIMGQVMGDASLKGQDMTPLYEQWASEAFKEYGLPVYFRPHPHTTRGNFKPNIQKIEGEYSDILANAHLVIAYNSNSLVDAVINGTPAVSMDKGSMAYEVTSHKICDRIRTEREQWAYNLAHCQWTPDEIKNGDWIDRLCKQVN